jgi:hypothetical protein
MKKPLKNIAASVRQKLLNLTKKQGGDFNRTLVRYAIERLLYRLSQHAARDRFTLKGAMLFITWPERTFRPSGDLDLLGSGAADPDSMKRLFHEICSIEDESDGIRFDAASITVTVVRDGEEQYQGVRISIDAHLDTTNIKVLVDVGFGDKVYPAPKRISFPCLLPEMRAAEVLAYPPETVVAEKFEAMVRYGEATSRLKDFCDIWTIATTFSFDKAALAQAIRGTLERRGSEIPTAIPVALTAEFAANPEKQKAWGGFLRRSPTAVALPSFEELASDLRRFLGPVIASLALLESAVGSWDPTRGWSEE